MALFTLAEQMVQTDLKRASAAAQQAAGIPEAAAAKAEKEEPPAAVGAALKRLVDFIPTETITLFWLAVPASESLMTWLLGKKPDRPTLLDWGLFVFLLVLTPVLLILIYLSGLASKKLPRPPVHAWPRWKAVAATIAFGTWAFAVPGNPFIQEAALLTAVWFVATLVSIILALVDPIVEQWGPK
jgi:hypothetical protein